MHCGTSNRTLDCCPFCRGPVTADMDLMQLHWRCGDGSQGSLWIYPGDPLSQLKELLWLSPAWQDGKRPSALILRAVQRTRTGQIVMLDATPLFMSDLLHGDSIDVLFQYGHTLVWI